MVVSRDGRKVGVRKRVPKCLPHKTPLLVVGPTIADCRIATSKPNRSLKENPTTEGDFIAPIETATMFRLGVRTFATTARRAAETVAQMEAPNQYGIGVSKAQGIVKGLTGGKYPSLTPLKSSNALQLSETRP